MAISTGNHPQELWPGLKKIFGDAYDEKTMLAPMVFDKVTSDKAYEKYLEETGFGLAPVKAEGAGVSYDTDQQGYVTTLTNITYGLGAIVTKEAIEDNQYKSVASSKTKKLGRSMRHTKENVAANVLNRAFTSGYNGGDGVVMCSAVHPTLNGTQSNTFAAAADLSEASIEDALTQIRGFTDSRGLRIGAKGMKLIIAPSEEFNATRILSSTNQSATANNDINALRSMGMLPGGTVVWDYLTDADTWFIKTNVDDGLILQQRRALSFTQDNDFDTDNARMKATERYVVGWGDWRGVFGVPGA